MAGQFINHFGAVRLRVTGTGTFEMRLISLDDVYDEQLADLTLSASNASFPTQLANFTQPRARLEGTVTVLDSSFVIKEIHIYIKPVFTSYPQ